MVVSIKHRSKNTSRARCICGAQFGTREWGIFRGSGRLCDACGGKLVPEFVEILALIDTGLIRSEHRFAITRRNDRRNTRCPYTEAPLQDQLFDVSEGGDALSVEAAEFHAPSLASALHEFAGTSPIHAPNVPTERAAERRAREATKEAANIRRRAFEMANFGRTSEQIREAQEQEKARRCALLDELAGMLNTTPQTAERIAAIVRAL